MKAFLTSYLSLSSNWKSETIWSHVWEPFEELFSMCMHMRFYMLSLIHRKIKISFSELNTWKFAVLKQQLNIFVFFLVKFAPSTLWIFTTSVRIWLSACAYKLVHTIGVCACVSVIDQICCKCFWEFMLMIEAFSFDYLSQSKLLQSISVKAVSSTCFVQSNSLAFFFF